MPSNKLFSAAGTIAYAKRSWLAPSSIVRKALLLKIFNDSSIKGMPCCFLVSHPSFHLPSLSATKRDMEGSFFPGHFFAALLISLSFIFCMNSSSAARPAADSASTEFIRTSCGTTTYPRLCYTSLSSHASVIKTDPRLLADAALSVTLSTARSTSTLMSKMAQSHGLKPREVAAAKDCLEVLSDSVDQLRKAMGEMAQIKGSNFGATMNDVQTWVSSALTDEDTCTDGFAGNAMNGNLKTSVRAHVLNMAHMTSNALALINIYASLHN